MYDATDRLVGAAFDASCPEKDRPYFTGPELAAEREDAAAAVVAVLRLLATDAADRGLTAHNAAQASRIDTHKCNFLGERAAEFNAAERFTEWANTIEEAS